MSVGLSIGEAARQSGVKVPTIRFYEQIGLLPTPPRTDGNRRLYQDDDVRRLAFIRHSRELGFDIEAIRTLLTLQDNPNQSCERADLIARERLREVEERIERLMALKQELQAMIDNCSHGALSECRVICNLADHGNCIHHHH
ncbi:MerR family transcriptional regulator [Oryzibacter oryziterrae]|uniref:MerR family transcriptional regulator n=1 Tax=Oryzibacter oryziterrae TaxID=2766474 RepID=UPI001F18751B|nr:helix-turn-helix domain-containing protein [Oryzibacter oryziterrae]